MRADSSLVDLPISPHSSHLPPQVNLKTTQNKNEFLREGDCKGRGLEAVNVQCLCVRVHELTCVCSCTLPVCCMCSSRPHLASSHSFCYHSACVLSKRIEG